MISVAIRVDQLGADVCIGVFPINETVFPSGLSRSYGQTEVIRDTLVLIAPLRAELIARRIPDW